MTIESPSTFGEYYWGKALDKDIARSEKYEKTLSPFVRDVINNFPNREELPPYLSSLFNSISSPTEPDLDTIQFRFLANIASGVAQRILGHEIKEFDYKVNKYLQNAIITPEIANILKIRNRLPDEVWLSHIQRGGFNEAEGLYNLESQKPWPTLPDVITYARYHGNPDAPMELARQHYNISDIDWPIWDWLSIQKLNTEQVQSLLRRRLWDDSKCSFELARLGWQGDDRAAMLDLTFDVPNSMLLVQGGLLQEQNTTTLIENISKGGIHPDYSQIYLDAILTKPPTTDIIAYELRQDPKLYNLGTELSKIGIHPNYHGLYKELAYQIPPVADIITMAVREAFTPEIAARFGQYQDLPPEFVEWVGKKGLSKEWATRYWAAHWSLPSPQQGFEMLHRGVIGEGELSLLLRALDIMPFWRDKLIQISYNPLTRIDVRRMYNLYVLNEEEVTQAYREIGYNETNAVRLTTFTKELRKRAEERLRKQQEKAAEEKDRPWTPAQTLGFLKKGLITKERAIHELQLLDYNEERINVYLESVKPTT